MLRLLYFLKILGLTCLAIAVAVSMWSPVAMCTVIPAFLQVSTLGLLLSRGGSHIPLNPRKMNPVSAFFLSIVSMGSSSRSLATGDSKVLCASARTRKPVDARAFMFSSTFLVNSAMFNQYPGLGLERISTLPAHHHSLAEPFHFHHNNPHNIVQLFPRHLS